MRIPSDSGVVHSSLVNDLVNAEPSTVTANGAARTLGGWTGADGFDNAYDFFSSGSKRG